MPFGGVSEICVTGKAESLDMKIVLSLTHRCNLACRYCYAGKSSSIDMSFDTAQNAVDFGMDRVSPGQTIDFQFFGGEPLLAFPLLQETTQYIQKRVAEKDVTVRLAVTTNGTLLTQRCLDFLNTAQFNVCISIDGPQYIHDANRVYPNGRGSFQSICRNLKRALDSLEHVQVNAVYSPQSIEYMPEAMSLFLALGSHVMHFNPDIQSPWSAHDYPALQKAFMQMARLYCDCYEKGIEIGVNFLDSAIILFLKGGYEPADLCGMADTQWAVAPSGNIYPCERLIGEDNGTSPFILGNVHTGLEHPRCRAIRAHVGNRNQECATCRLRRYCMNWCGCTNYFLSGQTDLAGPGLCAIQKASMQAAEYVFDKLAKCDTFINHFYTYATKTQSEVIG